MWCGVTLCARQLLRHRNGALAVASCHVRHQSSVGNDADAPPSDTQQAMASDRACVSVQHRGRLVRPTDARIAALIDEATSLSEERARRTVIALDAGPTHDARLACEASDMVIDESATREAADCGEAAVDTVTPSRNAAPPYSLPDDGAAGELHEATARQADDNNEAADKEADVTCDPLQAYELREQERRRRRQDALRDAPLEELLTMLTHYLRATDNVRLVSAAEEHVLFPVLLARLHELHVDQMLDLVELHWARSTLARYGTRLKDLIRDRIALIATAAATSPSKLHKTGDEGDAPADTVPKASAASLDNLYTSHTDGSEASDADAVKHRVGATASDKAGSDAAGDDHGDYLYVDEQQAAKELRRRDAVLARAGQEMNAATVLRCVTVMGLSAGHRKRDLDFFRILGSYLAFYINEYKDPHDLVRVLTAFARAKIVPSPRFLALLARRLPVLNKRVALEPLPCYRAMSNFARMGYPGLNLYRFLADCMLRRMEDNLADQLEASPVAPSPTTPPPPEAAAKGIQDSRVIGDVDGRAEVAQCDEPQDALPRPQRQSPLHALTGQQQQQQWQERMTCVPAMTARTAAAAATMPLCETSSAVRQARAALRRVTGLKSSMLTRWLLVLARSGAPHQQYMRPLLSRVLLPALPYLPPPSFSRLLHAARVFGAADVEFTAAVIDCMRHTLLPQRRLFREDVLALMYLLQRGDRGPIPHNLDAFVRLCYDCFVAPATTTMATTAAAAMAGETHRTNEEDKLREEHGADTAPAEHDVHFATPLLPLRPRDMYVMATYVRNLRLRRDDIDLATLAPLVDLMDNFTQRFAHLLRLGVVALTQVDGFLEALELQKQPDQHGHLARLRQQRQRCWQRCSVADDAARCATPSALSGTDAVDYDSRLDIDVRQTFRAIAMVNESRTYGTYRPLPGPLLVDFRNALARLSALDVLEAVDLYERASPGTLHAALARVLCRSLLAKLACSGEEVADEASHTLRLRPATELLLTRDDLRRLCVLLRRTPLARLRASRVTWEFVLRKAERLQMGDIATEARALLARSATTPMVVERQCAQAIA